MFTFFERLNQNMRNIQAKLIAIIKILFMKVRIKIYYLSRIVIVIMQAPDKIMLCLFFSER